MKHAKYIIGFLGIALVTAWGLYQWAFVDDGPGYFAEDWRRILVVAGMAVVGGSLVLVFEQLPTRIRWFIAEYLFGGIAVLAIIGYGYLVWLLLQMRSWFAEAGVSIWMIAGFQFLLCLAVAGLSLGFWYHFNKKRRMNSQKRCTE